MSHDLPVKIRCLVLEMLIECDLPLELCSSQFGATQSDIDSVLSKPLHKALELPLDDAYISLTQALRGPDHTNAKCWQTLA